ncbi:MAG: hypothetical protein AAF572_15875 [Cyanobacteria bacterium P01_B01_bin.77]
MALRITPKAAIALSGNPDMTVKAICEQVNSATLLFTAKSFLG